mmetsp:Transcript_59142/g.169871  ORF Transcript_59142/g.169871 Transcript_59142/m.169871 type:complete len:206 (-) Transcript_59142:69-686(-)
MATLADRTLAFDPNPEVFKFLQAHARLNPDLHIEAFNVGIAGEDGTIDFEYGDWCNGGVAGFGTGGGLKVKFSVVNLERFIERTLGDDVLQKIRYIKTDAEGFDFQILLALMPLIDRLCLAGRCPMLQVEWFDPFKDPKHPKGITAGSKRLFESLAKLPHGEWELLCSQQCNTADCHQSEQAIPEAGLLPTSESHCPDIIARHKG